MNKLTSNLSMIEDFIEALAAGMPLTGAVKIAAEKYNLVFAISPRPRPCGGSTVNTRLDVYGVTDNGLRGPWLAVMIIRQPPRLVRGGRHA